MLRYSRLVVFDGTLSAKVNTISLLRAGCRHTRCGEFVLKDVNMNRLTKSRPLTECEAMNLSLTDLYMRLKAYEDTKLAPEEVEAAKKIVARLAFVDYPHNFQGERTDIASYMRWITYVIKEAKAWWKELLEAREEAEKALEGMNNDER